ncbi:MAG TPA: hypothetical protein VLB67_03740 [Acidimicrobiia bacterium]|nr:hypothetical protein [Acidimicrobiia bacterium]
MVLIRIGAPRDVDAMHHIGRESGPAPSLPGGVAGLKRDLGAYLGVADGEQLFIRAIDADDIRNEHGVPWLVVYGVSANTRAFWSLATARRVLGYTPTEDSELVFADQVRQWVTDPVSGAPGRLG